MDSFQTKAGELPLDLIDNARGELLMQDQGVQILPIIDCDKVEIIDNSRRLIQNSLQAYPVEKRVLQV